MASPMDCMCILGFLVIISIANFESIDGSRICGESSPATVAFKFAPCMIAAIYEDVYVSSGCCSMVWEIGQNPSCLCAVFLSSTVKMAGIDPAVAITIPKRCNFDRPVGRKCGGYTLP